MSNRRVFMQGAIGVSALAVTPPIARYAFAATAARSGDADPCSLPTVVFDRNLHDGIAFGTEAARRGAAVQAFGSDIGMAWMNAIEPRLKLRPAALAGLTGGAPLFCLEMLARDYGLRVVYRIEHVRLGNGRVVHRATGHDASTSWTDRLTAAGDRWSTEAAALATRYWGDLAPGRPIELLDLAERPGATPRSVFSWLLAPRRRV